MLNIRDKFHENRTSSVRKITSAAMLTKVLRERRSPPNASIIDNSVNPDFGLRTPGSGRWFGSSPKYGKIELIGPCMANWPCPTPPRNFVKIRSQLFQLSDRQTDRQTGRSENITSFGGGNNKHNQSQN